MNKSYIYIDVNRRSPTAHLDGYSPDTDVFLLLITWSPDICAATRILSGRGGSQHYVTIKTAFEALGPERARVLIGFHAFTGSDITGRFASKTKTSCFKTFQLCSGHVLAAFARLGKEKGLRSPETVEALEEFVCRLYN